MTFRTIVLLVAVFVLIAGAPKCAFTDSAAPPAPPGPVYKDPHAPVEARVNDLFGRLTLAERHSLLTGTYFTTQPIDRLGVPGMQMADAGLGVRGGSESTEGPATLFPAGTILSASWDRDLARRIGKAIGAEAKNKGDGVQMLLGPDINIHRTPLGGRNNESYSEDPYLTGQIAAGFVQGVQSNGVGACLKHFVCNDQETDRGVVDVRVSQRALREIYLPGFETAVKQGHAWAVMTSYNKVNGHHSSENEYLLRNVLKGGWGFDGMVTSDWGGVHDTVGPVIAGNDLEMPGPGYLAPDYLRRALKTGQITEAQIDEADRRILRTVIRTGLLDGHMHQDNTVVGSPDHLRAALEGAEQGMVLLKNADGILPLDATQIKSIAVIGPSAARWQMGGGGSAYVSPLEQSEPLDAIAHRAGDSIRVAYAPGIDMYAQSGVPVPPSALSLPDDSGPGLHAEFFAGSSLDGPPAATQIVPDVQFDWSTESPDPRVPREHFCGRFTGKLTAPVSGTYQLSMTADDGCRLSIDGKLLIDQWNPTPGFTLTSSIDLVAGHSYDLRIDYLQVGGTAFCRFNWALPGAPNAFADAISAASQADVAIVVVGSGGEGEGADRGSMQLPGDEDRLIQAVATANKRTIVVLNNGGPVVMQDWLGQVPAVVEAWFPGEEGGDALAAILFGDVNPSGKLPDTIGARREDYPDYGNFPGVDGTENYAEGIYVGYRHFDKAGIEPLFPFGFGLSYTTFGYANLRLSSKSLLPTGDIVASIDITNTGLLAGAEVVQLYIRDPHPRIDKPVRELKGFAKVWLQAGQTRTVTFPLRPRDLAYCDVPGRQWRADAGVYDIDIGASSRDIRQTAELTVPSTYTEPIPAMATDLANGKARDLAENRPATASSTQTADTGAENAVDGDDGTRWSSQWSDPQWLAVDLGRPVRIGSVAITWEAAYAKAFAIQVSVDGQHWTSVYNTKWGKGGLQVCAFPTIPARWVRLYATKRATQWGYSVYSFQVFAPSVATAKRVRPRRRRVAD